jgi:hypothetical protein
MRDLIICAATQLLRDRDSFWFWSSITDRGIEEGSRNRHLAESVATIRASGCDHAVCDEVAGGINAKLASILESIGPSYSIKTFPNRGRDIVIYATDGTPIAAVEVKHVFDLTESKYYANVAADRDKLLGFRGEHPTTALFLIVYFVQLPGANYPAGLWYGKKDCRARSGYAGTRGVVAQYRQVMTRLGSATWPESPPEMCTLPVPSAAEAAALAQWYGQVFAPCSEWRFDAKEYFRGAAIGVAIWHFF